MMNSKLRKHFALSRDGFTVCAAALLFLAFLTNFLAAQETVSSNGASVSFQNSTGNAAASNGVSIFFQNSTGDVASSNGVSISFQNTTGDAAVSNGVSVSFQTCVSGPHNSAYADTKLVARNGPNGVAGPGANEPLGNRIPVILIHGNNGNRIGDDDNINNLKYDYFSNLISSLNLGGGVAYNNSYKTYSFHYESARHTTQHIARALRDHIDEMCEFGDKPIIIIAHSMGGIVARHYMLQTTNRGTFAGQPAGVRIQKLITLATPHHGTYGADLNSRGDRWLVNPGFANDLLAWADAQYWHAAGCDACISNPQALNRRSLLWKNDVSTSVQLDLYPNEQPTDMPDSYAFNDRIIAYSGDIKPDDPYWNEVRQAVASISGPPAVLDQCKHGSDDARLACGAYLIDSIRLRTFNLQYIPPPENDGLVPIESAQFDGELLMAPPVHCAGYNHLQMETGVGWGIRCEDNKFLFKSVRDRIIGQSMSSPPLLVGPNGAGFGSHTYSVARAGGAPVSTIDVQLSNFGDAALQITSLSLAGANADQFAIVNPPTLPLTIGAESSVHITVGFNPTSPGEKTAQLRAENSSSNSLVIVNISATGVPEECDLDFSPASQFMPTSGGSGEVMVGNISCPWTVSAVDDWIHPTALADRVSFTVDANAAADVRYGTMIVSVYGRSYLYSISQDAANAPCWLQLSSDQSVVQREAGSGSFYITAPDSCGWSFQSDSPWLVPSVATSQGSGSIGFTVADNSGADRSGIITITGSAMTAQFTVHQRGASITGTVTYGNAIGNPPAPRFVSNVLISAVGSPSLSVLTDALAGQYTLTGFGSGSYTLTPSKTGGVNGITSFDAARIAAHVIGMVPLTGNQLLVADVTGNGQIQSFDAARIAQYAAGLAHTSQTGNWKFVPVNRVYASIASNVTGEDFSALLMGEVSGNWVNTVGSRQLAVGSEQEADGNEPPRQPKRLPPLLDQGGELLGVELPQMTASTDKEIVIPVSVQGAADKGIISYEFDLRYDPAVMQPLVEAVDVAGTISRGLSVVVNPYEPGLLRVVVYGAMPIVENGILLNLRFTAVGTVGSISPLTFEKLMFNEGEPRVNTVVGKIELY